MRSARLALAAVLLTPFAARTDDAADAKAIIEKAIKARGDKPGAPLTAMTWKDKGTFTMSGTSIPYTADWAFQAPDKYRFVFVGTLGDEKFNLTVVANGEKAQEALGDMSREIVGPKLEYVRNEVYQIWVSTLTPLATDTAFVLAPAKGKDVAGKPTAAVKVTRDKRPAITLYFDKDSGHLVKLEATVKDEFQKWKEVPEEIFYSDYKESNGLKTFTRMKVIRDGKPLLESTLSDTKSAEKLDAKLFEKP